MTGSVCRQRLAVMLGGLMLAIGLASPAGFAAQHVGVDSGVNPQAEGTPPGALPRHLVLGQDIFFNERITTEATGQTQVLFVDESTLSVGPNANMVIDQFVYDPNAGTGKMVASLARGVFRYVGGKLSKNENAVTLRTPAATIGIRGAIAFVRVGAYGRTEVICGFCKLITVTSGNVTKSLFAPDFKMTVAGPGAEPSDATPAAPGEMALMTAQLDGRPGGNGGAPTVPTELMVANSGITNVVSANLAASVQAAAKTQPLQPQPDNVNAVVTQTELNNQNVQVTGASATRVNGGTSVAINQFFSNPNALGTGISGAASPTTSANPVGTSNPALQTPAETTPATPTNFTAPTQTATTSAPTQTAMTSPVTNPTQPVTTLTQPTTSPAQTITGGSTTTGSSGGGTTNSGSAGASPTGGGATIGGGATSGGGATTTGSSGGGTTTSGSGGASPTGGGTTTTGGSGGGTTTSGSGGAGGTGLPPVVITVAGLAKITGNPPAAAGFVNQGTGYRIPYTSGTITYPAGRVPQNGTFSTTVNINGQQYPVTLSPLTPGATTAVTAAAITATGATATATGTASTTQDGNFFYANLMASNGARLFIFGGVPVNSSFYAPTATNRFYAFTVNPDGALGSATSAQTIPFLPSNYGGTMAVQPGNVSPLYVVTPANVQFGVNNANTNPNAVAPKSLQASLAINGQGASQTSAFVVGNGSFTTSSDNGQVIASGLIRGTVLQSANGSLVQIYSHAHSVPDGNGNSLFGGNTISGFVLDQNENNINDNFVPNLATAVPFSPAYGASGGQPAPQYAFNQPVTAAPLPSNVGVTRSALNEQGYFGGIMETGGFISGGTPVSYVLEGVTQVQTDPVSSRVAATFNGVDPYTAAQSGVNGMVLQFGSLPGSGSNYNRSAFVDNNLYGALESPNTPSTITVTTNPGQPPQTMTLPLFNSANSASSPQLAMVTSATVPNNSWMPAGVTPCSCQYLQWGYWTGRVQTLTSTAQGFSNEFGAINTWIAGQPTVNLPPTGVGTYNGAAVGTVFNNGATYLAAGGFNQTYNFAAQTGSVNITNFDGASYSAMVSGPRAGAASNSFGGTLTAGSFGNRIGSVNGSFYGPGAAETGGSFNVQAVSGPKYLASGIFAGKQIP